MNRSRSRWCKTCEQTHTLLDVLCRLLVLDVVLLQLSEASYAAVHQHIANHLKMAPHRQSGAGKGCHIVSRLLNAKRAATEDNVVNDDDDRDDNAAGAADQNEGGNSDENPTDAADDEDDNNDATDDENDDDEGEGDNDDNDDTNDANDGDGNDDDVEM